MKQILKQYTRSLFIFLIILVMWNNYAIALENNIQRVVKKDLARILIIFSYEPNFFWTQIKISYLQGKIIMIVVLAILIALLLYQVLLTKKAMKNNEVLKSVVENIDEMLIRYNQEFQIMFATQHFCKEHNLSMKQVLAMNIFDFTSLDDRLVVKNMIKNLTKGISPVITTLRGQDGIRLYEWKTTGEYDKNGVLISAISFAHDITEDLKTQEKIKSLALFPEQNASPVLRYTLHGELLYANNPAKEILSERLRKNILLAIKNGENRSFLYYHSEERLILFNLAILSEFGYVNAYGTEYTQLIEAKKSLIRRTQYLAEQLQFEETIQKIADCFLKANSESNAMMRTLEQLVDAFEGNYAVYLDVERNCNRTQVEAAYVKSGWLLAKDVLEEQLTECIEWMNEAIEKMGVIAITDIKQLPNGLRKMYAYLNKQQIQSLIFIPVQVFETTMNCIMLASNQNTYDFEDFQLKSLMTISLIVAQGIKNKRALVLHEGYEKKIIDEKIFEQQTKQVLTLEQEIKSEVDYKERGFELRECELNNKNQIMVHGNVNEQEVEISIEDYFNQYIHEKDREKAYAQFLGFFSGEVDEYNCIYRRINKDLDNVCFYTHVRGFVTEFNANKKPKKIYILGKIL